MPGRSFNSQNYRYGFNGKENDHHWGDQLIQDYGFRLYNPAIGKFLSIDPLTRIYPMLTPYQFASNTPVAGVDLDGLEHVFYYDVIGNLVYGGHKDGKMSDYIAVQSNLDELEYITHNGGENLKYSDFVAIAGTSFGEASHTDKTQTIKLFGTYLNRLEYKKGNLEKALNSSYAYRDAKEGEKPSYHIFQNKLGVNNGTSEIKEGSKVKTVEEWQAKKAEVNSYYEDGRLDQVVTELLQHGLEDFVNLELEGVIHQGNIGDLNNTSMHKAARQYLYLQDQGKAPMLIQRIDDYDSGTQQFIYNKYEVLDYFKENKAPVNTPKLETNTGRFAKKKTGN